MADSKWIIKTTEAVASIIHSISDTICTILEIGAGWEKADSPLVGCVPALTTLQTTLANINEYIDSELGNVHTQWITDLDSMVSCCAVLIKKTDTVLSELRKRDYAVSDLSNKPTLEAGNQRMKHIQHIIEEQNDALILLLSAGNCETISQQRALLETESTRKIIRKAELNSASLISSNYPSSLLNQCKAGLSSLSHAFSSGSELIFNKLYEMTIPSNLKEAQSRQKEDIKAERRSREIDRWLQEDYLKKLKHECHVLMLGGDVNGMSEVVKKMKMMSLDGFTEEELDGYRVAIYRTVIDCAQSLVAAMSTFQTQAGDDKNKAHCDFIMNYSVDTNPNARLNTEVGEAIASIWKNLCVPEFLDHFGEHDFMDVAPYFFEEVNRIASPDYAPRELDILRARTKAVGMSETLVTINGLDIHLWDLGGARNERRKWIHCLDSITSVIFVVNLMDYDKALFEDSSRSRLTESLVLFESVANSRWFKNSPIILLLTRAGPFKERLAKHPLKDFFPDYDGGADTDKAAEYIVRRFIQVKLDYWNIHSHLVDTDDTSSFEPVVASIRETMHHKSAS